MKSLEIITVERVIDGFPVDKKLSLLGQIIGRCTAEQLEEVGRLVTKRKRELAWYRLYDSLREAKYVGIAVGGGHLSLDFGRYMLTIWKEVPSKYMWEISDRRSISDDFGRREGSLEQTLQLVEDLNRDSPQMVEFVKQLC